MHKNDFQFHHARSSELFSEDWTEHFSYRLALHHRLNKKPLTKEQFEYTLAETFRAQHLAAELMPANHVGADVRVHQERWSLKTQADKQIRDDIVNIHKMMEAGKGSLSTDAERRDLVAAFCDHLATCDRLFVLRCLPAGTDFFYPHYELLEVPLPLLQRARLYPMEVADSTRRTPLSFAVNVFQPDAKDRAFQLYFDGGSECKLRIKHLRKDECLTHVRWSFPKK